MEKAPDDSSPEIEKQRLAAIEHHKEAMAASGVDVTRDIVKAAGEELSDKEQSRLFRESVGMPPMPEHLEQLFDRIEFLEKQSPSAERDAELERLQNELWDKDHEPGLG